MKILRRKEISPINTGIVRRSSFPRWLLAVLILAPLIVIVSGIWFYVDQEKYLRREAEANLKAIAQLKADQIIAWREDQLGEAADIMEDTSFIKEAALWMANPQDRPSPELLDRLRTSQENYYYLDVLLVDTQGRVLLSSNRDMSILLPEAKKTLVAAIEQQRPMISDLHSGGDDAAPHTDTIAPLFLKKGRSLQPLGAVVFQNDAQKFLYPLIQSWPTISQTAETLLVRREGDTVLFLNELRHQKGTALKLRISSSQVNLPAVMATQGMRGVVKGIDYRGVEVLAVILPIPDSPWIMIAKIDEADALSNWRSRSTLILSTILGIILIVFASFGLVWQRNQNTQYRLLLQAEVARRMIEERFHVTLMSVGDGIIATDSEGHVELLNPVAESLTGWKQEEAFDKPLPEVFHIVNEETRQEAETPVQRVIREGLVVGLANHSLLIARDGSERAIADSGAPIRDPNGALTGVVLVFRDQTAERAAQKKLQDSEERFRGALENMMEGCQIVGRDWRYLYVNETAAYHGRSSREQLLGKTMMDAYPGIEKTPLFEALRRCMESRLPESMDNEFIYPDGNRGWFQLSIQPVPEGIFVLSLDITQRKKAEGEIQALNAGLEHRVKERTAQLENVNRELEAFSYSVSHDLRAPLRAIDGFSSALQTSYQDRLDEDGRHYLDRIREAAQKMADLINDLLGLSRLTRIEMRSQQANLSMLAENIAKELREDDPQRRVEFFIQQDMVVQGDAHLLNIVLNNLLGNAWKFTQMRSPARIEMGIAEQSGPFPGTKDETPVYFVRDNGAGFDMAYANKLFTPFQRLHGVQEFPGTGIGLATVYRIIARHGGRIWAESIVDQGATFFFTLGG